jgi:histidinol-phosphatase (PHP family)
MKVNHHTHTLYSDGKAEPIDYVNQAIRSGFDILGFSEHSPLPFDNPFSFRKVNTAAYCSLINEMKLKYADQLEICLGLELDYIPGMSEPFSVTRDAFKLDYMIGAVHLVKPGGRDELWFTDGPSHDTYDKGLNDFFAGDIREAVTAYYKQVNEMISTQEFNILAHFDKIKMHNRDRFFREDERWYKGLVDETISLIRERNLIVEVNCRGIYKKRSPTTYPGLEILKKLKELSVPVMVNSDAHLPEELDGAFDEAYDLLKKAGIMETVYFSKGKWKYQAIEDAW